MVRTSGFHPDNRGSIPLGDALKSSEDFVNLQSFFYVFFPLKEDFFDNG
ncbi:hypothetical protein TPE_2331 [Treponema pedis str. T A4]|uniref:Uncharacterized protein n=1 Tax=Treponema pedis str. T A4 TaxID=1291379 RepID=S5ZWM8_9SPIR|nr:hypothetical protein TPE_2331 [Treponema pedis str. T A4]